MSSFSNIWTANYTGFEYLANIGLPIFLLIVSLASFYWFFREIKKKRLHFRSMIAWFTVNIFYSTMILYVLIVTSLQISGVKTAINIFDWIAHYAFGFELTAGKEWVFIFIFVFISYVLIKTLRNSIKIADMQYRIDALNKTVAVLSGKINNTVDDIKKPKKK